MAKTKPASRTAANRTSVALACILGALAGCGRWGFEDHAGDPDGAAEDPLLRGCVLRLAMDEPEWVGTLGEVTDSCGGDDNGTAVNGATTVANGVRGRGGSFNEPGCVTIPDAARLRAGDALTISAWMYPTGLDQVNELGVISKRVDYQVKSEYSMFLWTDNKAWIDIDTEDDRFEGVMTFANNRWQQLTVVFDGSRPAGQRVLVYVDGALDRTAAETAPSITPFGAPLSVGCLPLSGPAQSFIGQLDEVVIWTRALDSAEVAAWFAETKP